MSLSSEMIIIVAAQMHSRIVDAALHCFQAFKEDKNLDSWQNKLRTLQASYSTSLSSTASSCSSTGGSSVNLSALDFVLSQMSGMREIVNQYYRFIASRIGPGMPIRLPVENNSPDLVLVY